MRGWARHPSTVRLDGRWRLFHHDTQLSNRNNFRSAKVVDVVHNPDGAIQTVDPFIR